MKDIQAISKARLKHLHKLLQKKGRDQEQAFLVEGARLVGEALASDWIVDDVCATAAFLAKDVAPGLLSLMKPTEGRLWKIRDQDLDGITDTVTSQGIVAVVRTRTFNLETVLGNSQKQSTIIVLQDVSDPGNVGTILRTCDWFGVDALLCSGESVELLNPKVVRASMGALFHVPVIGKLDLAEIIGLARQHSYRVYATTVAGGRSVPDLRPDSRRIFLFGSEARGLDQKDVHAADDCISIPSYGRAESLNVAIAAGIVLGLARISDSRQPL